jgi:hypothetical protein
MNYDNPRNAADFLAVAIMAIAIGTTSCGPGLVSDLLRPAADPQVSPPETASFEVENAVDLSWKPDPATDSYILERARDTADPCFSAIYSGTGLSFTDSGGVSRERYLYRLGKIRGNRLFGPSEAALGVFGPVRKDEHEPNGDEASATALSFERNSNIYFFRSNSGAVIEDIDWYAVDVPSRSRTRILITQTTGISQGDLYTLLDWYVPGETGNPAIVNDSSAREIINYDFKPKRKLIRISMNSSRCMADYTLEGGTMVNYVIKLAETRSL